VSSVLQDVQGIMLSTKQRLFVSFQLFVANQLGSEDPRDLSLEDDVFVKFLCGTYYFSYIMMNASMLLLVVIEAIQVSVHPFAASTRRQLGI
jgi:hypothetical protein